MAMTTTKKVTGNEAMEALNESLKNVNVPTEKPEENKPENVHEKEDKKLTLFEKHPILKKVAVGGTIAVGVGAAGYLVYKVVHDGEENKEAISAIEATARKALTVATDVSDDLKNYISENAKPIIESVATEVDPEGIKETVTETVSENVTE